ncbi:DUF3352 domain-containing protein [Chloroflexota bacterium]
MPVLIVISLLMSMAVLVFPTAASAEHEGEETAGFLPSETELYLTVNLDPGGDQLTGFWSVLNYWWQDPNVQNVWGELMDQVEEESDINILDDVLPWLGPELAMGVRNITIEPELVVFIGTMDKNASDAFIKGKFLPDVVGETGTPVDYDGVETLHFPEDGPYVAFTDEYIIVSSTQTFLEETLDMMDGTSLPSLADNDNFKQAKLALPERVGMLYGNLESFLAEIEQEIELGIADVVPPYFATSIKFEGTGMTGTGYYPLPEAITFSTTQASLLEAARVAPGNALFFASMDESASWMAATTYLEALWEKLAEATTGDLSEITGEIDRVWDEDITPLLGEMAEMSLADAVSHLNLEEALASLSDDLGLGDIWDEDIAPLLGELSSKSFEDAIAYLGQAMPDLLLLSESAVAVLPNPSLEEVPDILFITEATDVDKVRGYLDVVTGVIDSITEAQITTQSIGDVTATIIGDGDSVEVGYMFLDVDGTDYLVVGSTVDSLEAAVNVKDDPAKSLSQTEEYRGLSFQLGEIRGSFMYLNLTSMLKLEAFSALELGTSFDEEISQLFYYVPLKSALGFTNPILGEDGITVNGSLYMLPPPLVEQKIDEGFFGSLSIPEQTFDLSSVNPDLGQGAVQLDVDISDAPAGASIMIAAITDPAAEILSSFNHAADGADLSIEDIAFVVAIDKVNITSDEIGTATITLKVGKAWADEHGVDNIRIIRIGDDGTEEVLSTEFKGYEGDQAIFESISEDGLSYAGLTAVGEGGGDGTNWALIGGIIGGVVVVLAIATLIWLRRRSQPASLSS